MKRVFTKMHGAGNDFILVDDSEGTWSRSPDFIAGICDRHLGVGGDGVIYLCRAGDDDVIRMDYYNSDGSGAVCGNGLRCAASFALIGLTSACFAHSARPSCAPALTLARCSVAAHCASLRVLDTPAASRPPTASDRDGNAFFPQMQAFALQKMPEMTYTPSFLI